MLDQYVVSMQITIQNQLFCLELKFAKSTEKYEKLLGHGLAGASRTENLSDTALKDCHVLHSTLKSIVSTANSYNYVQSIVVVLEGIPLDKI